MAWSTVPCFRECTLSDCTTRLPGAAGARTVRCRPLPLPPRQPWRRTLPPETAKDSSGIYLFGNNKNGREQARPAGKGIDTPEPPVVLKRGIANVANVFVRY